MSSSLEHTWRKIKIKSVQEHSESDNYWILNLRDLYRKPLRETHTDTHLIQAANIPKASNAHYLCWPSWLLAASASDPWAGLGSASEPWTGSQEDLLLLSQVRRISLLFRLKDISSGRWQMAASFTRCPSWSSTSSTHSAPETRPSCTNSHWTLSAAGRLGHQFGTGDGGGRLSWKWRALRWPWTIYFQGIPLNLKRRNRGTLTLGSCQSRNHEIVLFIKNLKEGLPWCHNG